MRVEAYFAVLFSAFSCVLGSLLIIYSKDELAFNKLGFYVIVPNTGLLVCTLLWARWFAHKYTTDKVIEWYDLCISGITGFIMMNLFADGIAYLALTHQEYGTFFVMKTPLASIAIALSVGMIAFFALMVSYVILMALYNFFKCLCCADGNKCVGV
jgi:hypothetical protein